jgi:lipopolysaccharide/colanic/teichoic acid biosynthesis glycosyltransferase
MNALPEESHLNVALPDVTTTPRRAKRCLDLVLAVPGVVVLAPLFALLMIFIKLDSRGPAFFRQVRVGRQGRPFRIFKFRTMVADAEARGAQITVGTDQRITRVGHFLRRSKFDELPQLLNVVKGEMTLVGPRPEVPRYVSQYGEAEKPLLALTPGITSLASLQFRHESELLAAQSDPETFYLTQVMPEKVRIDLAYARRATVMSDLAVIAKTLFCLFS